MVTCSRERQSKALKPALSTRRPVPTACVPTPALPALHLSRGLVRQTLTFPALTRGVTLPAPLLPYKCQGRSPRLLCPSPLNSIPGSGPWVLIAVAVVGEQEALELPPHAFLSPLPLVGRDVREVRSREIFVNLVIPESFPRDAV